MPSQLGLLRRTAKRIEGEIREIFLSATVADSGDYRTQVQEALRAVEVAVFLQEEWNSSARPSVDLCLDRLCQSDAYMGLFGFRYGWIPETHKKSITELECDKAFQYWGEFPDPPIFLFLPAPGSAAAKELARNANKALRKEHPEDVASQGVAERRRLESKQSQKDFCDRLRNKNRFIRDFKTVVELRERAIACVANWNRDHLRNATRDRRQAPGDIPPDELGQIDRAAQREALKKALRRIASSDSMAMAVLVHGEHDMGHTDFFAWLESWHGWSLDSGPFRINPPHGQKDIAGLILTATCAIAPERRDANPDFGGLASAVLERCGEEPVVFLLTNIACLPGGLGALHRDFWTPLLAALRERTPRKRPEHRLTLVVDHREALSPPYPDFVWSGAPNAPDLDFSRLIPLPPLAPFTDDDVEAWLDDHKLDVRRQADIVQRVIGNGKPLEVFDRLNAEEFWRELVEGGRR